MEPISHYYYSHRLKLHFWDWGNEGKPALIAKSVTIGRETFNFRDAKGRPLW